MQKINEMSIESIQGGRKPASGSEARDLQRVPNPEQKIQREECIQH